VTIFPTESLHRVADLDSFLATPPDHTREPFRRLAEQLHATAPDTDPDATRPAVATLIAALRTSRGKHTALLAILLGMIAESSDESLRAAVHDGLPDYLDIARTRAGDNYALALALAYLLAHFAEDREAILVHTASLPLDAGDYARIERCLAPLNPDDPELTRVWPEPRHWRALPDTARELDRQWMRQVPPEQMRLAYHLDTRSLLAYAGAKALWTVEHGSTVTGPDPDLRLPPANPNGHRTRLGDHLAALRCPKCTGALAGDGDTVSCASCGEFPVVDGTVDLSLGAGDAHEPMTRNVPLCYSEIRPAFLRWKGSNWDGAVTVEDEDEYLRTHVQPADGPILDLGAGTGRWTAVLADTFGAERVIALDLSAAMLEHVRRGLPQVLRVRGNALSLPFNDGSLGAVNCWNALQSMPDPAAVVAEVGRCLRPGGTFTLMTFRPAVDPIYRALQTAPFGLVPVALSAPQDLRQWLAAAGMSVWEQYTPGSFLFVTAVREPR